MPNSEDRSDNPNFNKQRMIVIKGQQITKADYRGILALILLFSYLYAVLGAYSCSAIEALGPLTGSAITYYFHDKIVSRR